MGDDYKVRGTASRPRKANFGRESRATRVAGQSGRIPPKEPLDFEKLLVAELKSPMTINEAGNKKRCRN